MKREVQTKVSFRAYPNDKKEMIKSTTPSPNP